MRRGRPAPVSADNLETQLSNSPPLFNCVPLFDTGYLPVEIHLDSPLCNLTVGLNPRRTHMATLAMLCSQMQFYIEKEAQVSVTTIYYHADVMAETSNFAMQIAEGGKGVDAAPEIQAGLERLYSELMAATGEALPDLEFADAMNRTGMVSMFPKVAQRLQLREENGIEIISFKEYLTHIAQLNQLVSMAEQLQADIPTTNHKYMAHQIALFYQCLSYPNLKTAGYKKQIEPQFDQIKKNTEQAQTPQLSNRQSEWLSGLTEEVLGLSTDLTAYPASHIEPWMSVLQTDI